MIEGAAVLLVGILIGAGIGGWGAWHAALVFGRNKIERARSAERLAYEARDEALESAEAAKRGEQSARGLVREIEANTVERAISSGLVKVPEPKPVKTGGKCGCNHAKAFHTKVYNHNTQQEDWLECRYQPAGSGPSYRCKCQNYAPNE